MKLYNSLTREIEDFAPLKDGQASIYSCGPTVYDHIHIGNLASFIYADTLRRTLEGAGFKVRHIMNFTDVDDKTIRRSRESYPDMEPNLALEKLTDEYGSIFLNDMDTVGNNIDSYEFIKATDAIPHMQKLIRELYEQRFAYIADDGVYFSIDKYRSSGKTYGQLTDINENSTSQARINNDEYDKNSIHDFALWKKQKQDEPAWNFELDGQDLAGRPGWHIECSAMSTEKLGQPFDIHTGGVDLKFPHHENEIAQSTAGKENPTYANGFVHNEHLLVNGQKMSKSLNNFITLADIIDKGFDPLAFRLLVLQSHYRNQAHFSWANLEAAENRLKDFRALADLQWQARENINDSASFALMDIPSELQQIAENDLNTPEVLARFSEISSELQTLTIRAERLSEFQQALKSLDNLLGLQLADEPDITQHQKDVIAERESARETKDWTKSDKLRDVLVEQGIGLRDTPNGAIWYRL
jgi:cysteinyl-tRNA synthetase